MMMKNVIIIVDGLSGVGKGIFCYVLVEKLGFDFLDFGVIYCIMVLDVLKK